MGAVITSTNGDICEIDTFLLSCRVIGRTIETAVLGYLAEACRAEGARFLQGWFIPTAKDARVRELYSNSPIRSDCHQRQCNPLETEFGGSGDCAARVDSSACRQRNMESRTSPCLIPPSKKVLTIAADVFQVDESSLSSSSSPDTIESWDSLHHLSLVVALNRNSACRFRRKK